MADHRPISPPGRFISGLRAFGVPSPASMALAAVGAGIALRIDGLDRKSLWADEVFTAQKVAFPSLGDVFRNLSESPFPPLYYMIIWLWSRLWGIGDVTLRALPVLLGVLCLPATYLIWRPLIGGRAASWALSLLALNAYHIAYSQDAKMYSAVWLLAAIGGGAFLHAVFREGPGRLPWLVAYGLATSCLPLISFVGVVPLGVQVVFGAFLLWKRPGRRWAVADAGVAASLAMIPTLFLALPTAISATSQGTGIDWIPTLTPSRLPQELYRYLGVLSLGYRPSAEAPEDLLARLLDLTFAPCVALAATLLVASLIPAVRRGKARPDSLFAPGRRHVAPEVVVYLAAWFAVPVAAAMICSLAGRSFWGVPRYLFGSAPALALWLGVALADLRPRPALALATSLLAANLASVTFDRTHTTRTPWRGLARAIEEVAATTECLDGKGGAGGGTEMDLAVTSLGRHEFDRVCLAHALRHDALAPTRVQPVFLDLAEAVKRGGPFVVVMVVYMGPTSPDGMRADLERAVGAGRACRRIFKEQVFQEPYTGMPTPYMRHSVEAWLCAPRGPESRPAVGGSP